MLRITSMIPTHCEGPNYPFFAFYPPRQLSRHLLSPAQFTTLSAPCAVSASILDLVLSCVPGASAVLAWWSCHLLVQIRWPMHHFSSGVSTTFRPVPPTILAETFNSAAFRALLDKKTSQFQDPAFQMLFVKRQLHKTPIHKQSYRSPTFKRPLCHSASEFRELHQR